jgi:hypothetical protein
MISLPSQISFSGLEDFLHEVHQSPGQSLKLPLQVRRGGAFSFSAVALQAVATWARIHTGERQLVVARQFATDEITKSRLSGTLFGMAGLYFANELLAGDIKLSRPEGLEAVTPRVFAMQDYRYRDTLRGQNSALCCFERAKLEFIQSLYAIPARGNADTTTVRSESEFKVVLSRLLDACASGTSNSLEDTQLEVLSQLVHQLIKNADVHTQTDAKQTLSKSGIRGLQVRVISIGDEEAFSDFVAEDRALHAYLVKLGRRRVVRERGAAGKQSKLSDWQSTSFAEITVFDTGPGLALRWLSKKTGAVKYADFDEAQELEAVKSCFELHATSHTSPMKGDGLPIALQAMRSLRAFMFLRTGRLALFQDFSSGSKTDFSPNNRYGVRRLQEAVGATYSICFPLTP